MKTHLPTKIDLSCSSFRERCDVQECMELHQRNHETIALLSITIMDDDVQATEKNTNYPKLDRNLCMNSLLKPFIFLSPPLLHGEPGDETKLGYAHGCV